jgi:hypothetical protein
MGLVWYYQCSNPVMSALGRSTLSRLQDDMEFQEQNPSLKQVRRVMAVMEN